MSENRIATMHSLERTSPKGGPFIGRCVLCGREGLTPADMGEECVNAACISEDDALLAALNGDTDEH